MTVLCFLFAINIAVFLIGCRYRMVKLMTYWFSPMGLFYFASGMAIPLNWQMVNRLRLIKPFSNPRSRRLWGLIGFGVATGVCSISVNSDVLFGLRWHCLVFPLEIVSLFLLMPEIRFDKIFLRNTFGIYALHVIVIHYTEFMCDASDVVMAQLLYSLGVIAVSVGVSEAMHRLFPRVASVLFGGR